MAAKRKAKKKLPPCEPKPKRARSIQAEPFCARSERYCRTEPQYGTRAQERDSVMMTAIVLGLFVAIAVTSKNKTPPDGGLLLPADAGGPVRIPQQQRLDFDAP